jgi:hypothetical protein
VDVNGFFECPCYLDTQKSGFLEASELLEGSQSCWNPHENAKVSSCSRPKFEFVNSSYHKVECIYIWTLYIIYIYGYHNVVTVYIYIYICTLHFGQKPSDIIG